MQVLNSSWSRVLCRGWKSLSFWLITKFILNPRSFQRTLLKAIYFSPKLHFQRLNINEDIFQQICFHLCEIMCISHFFFCQVFTVLQWGKPWGLHLTLWVDQGAQADCCVTHLVAMSKTSCPDLHHSLWVLRCTGSLENFSLKHLTTDLEMILNIL